MSNILQHYVWEVEYTDKVSNDESKNLFVKSAVRKRDIVIETFESFRSFLVFPIVLGDVTKQATDEGSELTRTSKSEYRVFDSNNLNSIVALITFTNIQSVAKDGVFKVPLNTWKIVYFDDYKQIIESIIHLMSAHYEPFASKIVGPMNIDTYVDGLPVDSKYDYKPLLIDGYKITHEYQNIERFETRKLIAHTPRSLITAIVEDHTLRIEDVKAFLEAHGCECVFVGAPEEELNADTSYMYTNFDVYGSKELREKLFSMRGIVKCNKYENGTLKSSDRYIAIDASTSFENKVTGTFVWYLLQSVLIWMTDTYNIKFKSSSEYPDVKFEPSV